ncbi:MAG: hypothetical protein U0795_17630 [Pirellulales bacterium]
MPRNLGQFGIRKLLASILLSAMILAASQLVGMELLVLFFPLVVAIGVYVSTAGQYPKLFGASGGAISGLMGLVAPAIVWSYLPLESGMVHNSKMSAAAVLLPCAVLGAIAGAILGTLYGEYIVRKRRQQAALARNWPVIAIVVLVSTWTVLLIAISSDPWIYFHDAPEDYIAFENRIYMALMIGTPIALFVLVPVALIASTIYHCRDSKPISQADSRDGEGLVGPGDVAEQERW